MSREYRLTKQQSILKRKGPSEPIGHSESQRHGSDAQEKLVWREKRCDLSNKMVIWHFAKTASHPATISTYS